MTDQQKQLDWTDIHPEFARINGYYQISYQKLWEKIGLTYQEAQEWIAIDFKPDDYILVSWWLDYGFTLPEVKEWISKGLTTEDSNLAAYARYQGYNPHDINKKELTAEFEQWKNQAKDAQDYLDSFYPLASRNRINELDISKNNLTGALSLAGFVNLTTLYCSDNKLTELNLSNCYNLVRLYCRNNFLIELNLNCFSLFQLDCSNNKLTSLDLRNYFSLSSISCKKNNLIDLKLNNCLSLFEINCQSQNPPPRSPVPKPNQNHLYCRQCGKNSRKNFFCESNCGRSQIDSSKTRDDYNEEVKSNYIPSSNWNNKQKELIRKYGGYSMGIDHCNYCGKKYDKIAHTQEPLYINHDIQNCKSQRNIDLGNNNHTNQEQPFWKNPLVIGGIIISLLVIAGALIYFTKKKNHDQSK